MLSNLMEVRHSGAKQLPQFKGSNRLIPLAPVVVLVRSAAAAFYVALQDPTGVSTPDIFL